ncbi:MAG: hypothetical protein NW224_21035 [Leptolyngbyaceae cyanobacterium bins.302]|nr:hypothetical protein [Leptolyngbyaceae cyanobacterium bins.302]
MLKAAFNQFDPKQVLSDLYAHREWWKSFAMEPPLPEDTEYPLLMAFLRSWAISLFRKAGYSSITKAIRLCKHDLPKLISFI